MSMIVKICGIKTTAAAQTAKACGADLLGFVFAPSKRRVEPAQVQLIARDVKGIGKVGVFVNAPLPEMLEIVQRCRLDYVQLHGDETAAYRCALSVPVIKAFKATPILRSDEIEQYHVKWALLDTFVPGQYGGTGQTFDWYRMQPVCQNLQIPFLIAGGLTPENVSEAIRMLKPHGVDVSGGVETDGGKDMEKIDRFIQAVRTAERGDLVADKDITG